MKFKHTHLLQKLKKNTLFLLFSISTSIHANFIVIDEIVKNDDFHKQVEIIGNELSSKTNINLYMSLTKNLGEHKTIIDYQKNLIKTLKQPAILFSFVEDNKQVQIFAEDKSLYETFDRKEIMSPLAIWPFFNGRVIPIITAKAPKEVPLTDKYAVAMFNGYAEISEQVSSSKGIILDSAVGDTNKTFYKYMISFIFSITFLTILKLLYDSFVKRRKNAA